MCPPRLSPQWLCGNSWTPARDIRFIMYIMCSSAQWPQSHCGDMYNMYMYICVYVINLCVV